MRNFFALLTLVLLLLSSCVPEVDNNFDCNYYFDLLTENNYVVKDMDLDPDLLVVYEEMLSHFSTLDQNKELTLDMILPFLGEKSQDFLDYTREVQNLLQYQISNDQLCEFSRVGVSDDKVINRGLCCGDCDEAYVLCLTGAKEDGAVVFAGSATGGIIGSFATLNPIPVFVGMATGVVAGAITWANERQQCSTWKNFCYKKCDPPCNL